MLLILDRLLLKPHIFHYICTRKNQDQIFGITTFVLRLFYIINLLIL